VAELGESGSDGYYDASGEWVEAVMGGAEAEGYYDDDGNWVEPGEYLNEATGEDPSGNAEWEDPNASAEWGDPGFAGGYYDEATGVWVEPDDGGATAAAEGYYDDGGQWVEPAGGALAIGESTEVYYDEAGQWFDTATGDAFEDGGHYDEGTGDWVAPAGGAANEGYYDEEGYWVEPVEAGGSADAVESSDLVVAAADDEDDDEGYWDVDGEWVEGPPPNKVHGTVVVSVLRAVGLRAFRLHAAADSYDALSLATVIGSSKPYVTV
jgi:hypothetical protein